MATAVKNTPDTTTASLFDRAAAVSLVGIVYVVGCFGIVFQLLPYLFWNVLKLDPSLTAWQFVVALLIIAAAMVLLIVGLQLLGSRAPRGTRAGIFIGVVGVILILLLTRWASLWFEHWASYGWFSPLVGASLTALFGLALLIVGGYYFLNPKFEPYLVTIEDQGWFSVTTFKPLQGVRVRRGTILGILLIAAAGLWTLYSHGTLSRLPANWELNIPFTGRTYIDLDAVFGKAPNVTDQLAEQGLAQINDKKLEDLTPQEQKQLTDTVLKFVDNAGKTTQALDSNIFLAKQLREKFPDAFQKWSTQVNDYVAGKSSNRPTFVVDSSALRDFNHDLSKYVIIKDSGSSDLQDSTVVPKSEADKVIGDMREQKRQEPTTAPPPPIGGSEAFATVLLLPLVPYTLLFLLAGVSAWLAWRIVHFPMFADFLIATEAELNKVSWTTRSKLVQDTIVVLITVFLMAVYLFAMDQVWVQLLSWKPVRILQIQQKNDEANKSVENKPW